MDGDQLGGCSSLVVLGLAFLTYCLVYLAHNDVRYLPKWVWALSCFFSIPFGGIVYLLVGRDPASRN